MKKRSAILSCITIVSLAAPLISAYIYSNRAINIRYDAGKAINTLIKQEEPKSFVETDHHFKNKRFSLSILNNFQSEGKDQWWSRHARLMHYVGFLGYGKDSGFLPVEREDVELDIKNLNVKENKISFILTIEIVNIDRYLNNPYFSSHMVNVVDQAYIPVEDANIFYGNNDTFTIDLPRNQSLKSHCYAGTYWTQPLFCYEPWFTNIKMC